MLVPSNKQSWGVRRGMAGEKIRLQRDHSESQRHVQTHSPHPNYWVILSHFSKSKCFSINREMEGKKAFLHLPGKNKLVEIFQVMKYVSFPAHCFPRKPSQCLCLVQEDAFCSGFCPLQKTKTQPTESQVAQAASTWPRGLLFIALEYKRGAPRPGHSASQNNKTLEMA